MGEKCPKQQLCRTIREMETKRELAVFILSIIGIPIVNNGSANYNWSNAADAIHSLQSMIHRQHAGCFGGYLRRIRFERSDFSIR
jgi:hypothetical protein